VQNVSVWVAVASKDVQKGENCSVDLVVEALDQQELASVASIDSVLVSFRLHGHRPVYN